MCHVWFELTFPRVDLSTHEFLDQTKALDDKQGKLKLMTLILMNLMINYKLMISLKLMMIKMLMMILDY